MNTELSAPSPSQPVTVLVVDDADVMRQTLRSFFEDQCCIKLLGEATNLAEAVSLAATLKPEVILLDIHLPGEGSVNPELVKRNFSGARILAMSLLCEIESEKDARLRAESFGAVKILDKANLLEELIPAILQTARQ